MQVTSDTLFHFTPSLKNLKNILSKKFQLTYCHEKYLLDYETHNSYYPMISFCDIPLSLAKNQIERYGSYAIGMTKDWGTNNNLNPVVYLEKDSLLSKDIQATIANMLKSFNTISTQVKKVATSTSKMLKKSLDKVIINNENIAHEKKTLLMEELLTSREHLQNSLDSISDFKELSNKLGETVNNIGNLFRYIKNYEGTLIRNNKAITIPYYIPD